MKRKENESFEDYKKRRKESQAPRPLKYIYEHEAAEYDVKTHGWFRTKMKPYRKE